MHDPIHGVWESYPLGAVDHGRGGSDVLRLSDSPFRRFVRILMTASSNTCATQPVSDPRIASVMHPRALSWYDIRGRPLPRYPASCARQEQTTTYCSSVDPWHEASDLGTTKQAQVGLTFFSQAASLEVFRL